MCGYFTQNLWLIDKASIHIDFLWISDENFQIMSRFFKDQQTNFIIDGIELSNDCKTFLLNEDIEVLNQINPKVLTINQASLTYESIKALTLLKWESINVKLKDNYSPLFKISFFKAPVQLFDSKAKETLSFEWESIVVKVNQNKFNDMVLFSTDTIDYLFIPFETINEIQCSKFKEVSTKHGISKKFDNLNIRQKVKTNGIIIPLKCLHKVSFLFLKYMARLFDSNQEFIDKIFKAKYIDWTISYLNEVLEIKNLLPDHFPCINFAYINMNSKRFTEKHLFEIMYRQDYIEWRFSEIRNKSILTSNEFILMWEILNSSRIKFTLTSISLSFETLSECMKVLSLCADCFELDSVDLQYKEAEAETEQETIRIEKAKFMKKFGPIRNLRIMKIRRML